VLAAAFHGDLDIAADGVTHSDQPLEEPLVFSL
jgi:hypothetical protein